MIHAFYSGLSGAKGSQNRLNISANNIANINSPGFQAQQGAFTDVIYTNLQPEDGAKSVIQTGNGVKSSGVLSLLGGGAITQTGRSEDAALKGDGFFALRDGEGTLFYTRCGNFHFENRDDGIFLVTSNGDFVLNDELIPVTKNGQGENVRLSGPASESSQDGEMSEAVNLAVFKFANPNGLIRDGYGRLTATAVSGQGEMFYEACVEQGSLEGSNVDLAAEMSNLLQAQRGFQFSTKVIQTVDEMENTANNLRP